MISFFFRKNRLYLHQYLCINVVYSIFFLCVFFMTRKNINISHLFYTLIYVKAVPINSYLLCTSVYIVVVFLSATSFIGAPIISLSLIYKLYYFFFKKYKFFISDVLQYNSCHYSSNYFRTSNKLYFIVYGNIFIFTVI